MGAYAGGDRPQRACSPHAERGADGGCPRSLRGAHPLLIDYHVHSAFSCDCETGIWDICETAVARGLAEIAICDHAEFTPLDECTGYLRPGRYLAEVRRCQRAFAGDLAVRAGVEIGEPFRYPSAVAQFLDDHEFDFVLGSLHFVDGLPNFSKRFFQGRTLDQGVGRYLAALGEHAATGDFDVLAHFDIVSRAAYRAFRSPLVAYDRYEDAIRRVLSILVDRGKGIEINTATTCRGMGSLAPARQVLHWYREMGGTIVTVGSDAHTQRAVGAKCDEAIEVARSVGFSRIATFERRQLHWLPI